MRTPQKYPGQGSDSFSYNSHVVVPASAVLVGLPTNRGVGEFLNMPSHYLLIIAGVAGALRVLREVNRGLLALATLVRELRRGLTKPSTVQRFRFNFTQGLGIKE